MGEAFHQTHLDWITTADKYNGNFIRRFCGSERLRWTDRENDIDPVLDQLFGELRKAFLLSFAVARHNEEVLAIDVAEITEPLTKRCEKVWAARWEAGLKMPDFGDPRLLS